MSRIVMIAWAVAAALWLSGCGSVPQLDVPDGLTVADIVDRVECEIWEARQKYSKLNGNWIAVVNLTLNVEDSVGINPTVTVIHPLAAAGALFSIGGSATIKSGRQRIYTESLELPVSSVRAGACHPPGYHFDLTGNLGIVETVGIGLGSIDDRDPAQFPRGKDKEAFGQTVKFVVTKGISGLGPVWNLVNFTGPGGLVGADRIDTHELIISFASVEKEKKAAVSKAARLVTQPATLTVVPAIDKARQLNQNMLLQSLPVFRSR